MAILNVGNTQAELAGQTYVETNAARFDAAYSPDAVGKAIARLAFSEPVDVRFPAPTNDLWIHFKYYSLDWGSAGSVDGYWFEIRDDNDVTIVGCDVQDLNWHVEAFGATGTSGVSFGVPELRLMEVDIRVGHGATNEIDLYINGGLMSSASIANNGKGAPVRLYFNHSTFTESSNQEAVYSELIITDGEPTLGWRLATLTPDTAGFHGAWLGAVTDLADQDMATFMASATPGERFSWNPTAYGGPALAAGIRAVCAKAQAQRGIAGPQNLRQFLRIAGTDYDGTPTSPIGNQQIGELEVWDQNPDTLVGWATADLAALEVGVLSEA